MPGCLGSFSAVQTKGTRTDGRQYRGGHETIGTTREKRENENMVFDMIYSRYVVAAFSHSFSPLKGDPRCC